MHELIKTYLESETYVERQKVVKDIKTHKIEFSLETSLEILSTELSLPEKIEVLTLTTNKNNIEYEEFITSNLYHWDSNLSAFALREWARKSGRIFWFRIVSLLNDPFLSQRMKYTILDLSPLIHMRACLDKVLESSGLEDLSDTFKSLLIKRCLEANYQSEIVDTFAGHFWQQFINSQDISFNTALHTLAWMLKYNKKTVENSYSNIKDSSSAAIIRMCYHASHKKSKLSDNNSKRNSLQELNHFWPPIWIRDTLTAKHIKDHLTSLGSLMNDHFNNIDSLREQFGGIDSKKIANIMLKMEDPIHFLNSLTIMERRLTFPYSKTMIEKTLSQLKTVENIEHFLGNLPEYLKLQIQVEQTSDNSETNITAIFDEEKNFINNNFKPTSMQAPSFLSKPDFESSTKAEFFSLSIYKDKLLLADKDRNCYWSMLAHNWVDPQEDDLDELNRLAREKPYLSQIYYIRVLAKFVGHNKAALKLVEYIRHPAPEILIEVIRSLGKLGTPRALQELISCMTRPNINPSLKLEICDLLSTKSLDKVQVEIKSTLREITLSEQLKKQVEYKEIYDKLSSFASSSMDEPVELNNIELKTADLDEKLTSKISEYHILSSEVKRALRTAEFFYTQMEYSQDQHSIDMSPIIDMQYKALELIFREAFEYYSINLIKKGLLQRKLDVIGYSRPIPKAMESFEDYLSKLPIIESIPYFSKFKLRKLLRSICQFKPGRRFTLDGIKAFSLFFLAFARKKCEFGLENIVDLGLESDQELFEFCRLLHMFQDFRNRAAHEGFRPEARSDMSGLWENTAKIIEIVLKILEHILPQK